MFEIDESVIGASLTARATETIRFDFARSRKGIKAYTSTMQLLAQIASGITGILPVVFASNSCDSIMYRRLLGQDKFFISAICEIDDAEPLLLT